MYRLHYSPDTASMVVRIVLAELGVPHEALLIDRAAGQTGTPGYRALHPLGLIPAMETPNGPMFETAAILLHLADRHGALAPATDDLARGAFLTWYFFTSTNIHTTLMQLFYPERVAGPDHSAVVLTHAAERMRSYLVALEAMLVAERPQWLSPAPGILGHYLGMLVRWLGGLPGDHPGHLRLTDYPALHAVLAAQETRPAALTIAADEGLGPTIYTQPAA